jgi:hypothetical protein
MPSGVRYDLMTPAERVHHRRRGAAELAGPAGAREPEQRPVAATPRKVWRGAERNRALRVLAGAPNGCTEAIMLAHGFTVETLGRLVLDGLATATPGTAVQAGGRQVTVTWLAITDLGRQALAG